MRTDAEQTPRPPRTSDDHLGFPRNSINEGKRAACLVRGSRAEQSRAEASRNTEFQVAAGASRGMKGARGNQGGARGKSPVSARHGERELGIKFICRASRSAACVFRYRLPTAQAPLSLGKAYFAGGSEGNGGSRSREKPLSSPGYFDDRCLREPFTPKRGAAKN